MGADDNAGDERHTAGVGETNELIEHFKTEVDREALRENLRLTPAERVAKMLPSPELALHEPPVPSTAADAGEDLVEAFKKDVDRTLLIENLKLTPADRMETFVRFMESIYELRRAGRRPKDFLAVAELEALVEERNKRKGQ